jgi:hypothetical protein
MKKVAILIIVITAVFAGCKHELEQPIVIPGGNGGGGGGGSDCDPDSVYFTNTILPIIQSNCQHEGCHGTVDPADDIVLETYDQIVAGDFIVPGSLDNSEIYELITENDPDDIMPQAPYEPLSQDEIDLIADWILQGAPNNSCDACDTTNVTFSGVIGPFVALQCESCHSGSDPDGGLLLTNYAEISASANTQEFLDQILVQNGAVGMPYNNAPMAQCRIDQLLKWIEDGTPNN